MSHRDLRQAVVALPAISDPQAIAGGSTAVYARSRAPNEALADEIDRLIAEGDMDELELLGAAGTLIREKLRARSVVRLPEM